MTKEEIINTPELVDFMLDESVITDSREKLRKRLDKVCNLAIKALEQEPCDDAISRQAVLDRKYVVEIKNMWHMTEKIEVVNVDDIKALPPVKPQYTE